MTQPPDEVQSPTSPESAKESEERDSGGPTIRDRRRIDPDTYEVREQASAAPADGDEETDAPDADAHDADAEVDPQEARIADLTKQVAERTDDLQRLQAEYVNYKRRVDRDRESARGVTIGAVLTELLPVLDNIQAARDHGELVGGFKGVAEGIAKVASKYGVEAFGAVGDEFDPHLHDALMQVSDPGDAAPVCAQIFQVGYRMGDRVLRPARVATGAPEAAAEEEPSEPAANGAGTTEPAEQEQGDVDPEAENKPAE